MRPLFISFLLLIFPLCSWSQKISYDIPDGLEKEISKADYKTIVDLAVPIVSKRYQVDFLKGGTIQLKGDQDMGAFNLDNLVLACVDVKDKSQWKRIIEGHFENMFASIDEQKNIDPENYETIKKYLSIRIYPTATIDQYGGQATFVTRTDLDGTYTLLMLDLPGAFTPVQKGVFDLWRKDAAEVFQIAQVNINKQVIEKVTKTFDIDGSQIEISFLGNEDYAASYGLDLQNNSPDLVGECGSVVAIPNKGLVNVCKISKDKPLDFVKFIQRTNLMIQKSYQDHPQPISSQFFWYYQGAFTTINVTQGANGDLNVLAPLGLSELFIEK